MTARHGPLGAGTDERSVPDLLLERGRLGELPSPEQDAFARRIEAEPELRERLAALERSDGELRGRFAAGHLAAGVRARLATRREGRSATPGAWSRAWPLPAGLAAAAAVALVVSLRTTVPAPRLAGPSVAPAAASPSAPTMSPHDPGSPPTSGPVAGPALPASSAAPALPAPTGEPGVRIKGLRPALSLFRKTADGSETLADGDVARDGDVIRIGYRPFGRRYGVIVSLDGRGGVTRHLPDQGATAAHLETKEVVLLARAYQLDDAPAWERFFFVTADAPFQVATVEEAARQVVAERGKPGGQAPAGLPLPAALEQSTFLLMKE